MTDMTVTNQTTDAIWFGPLRLPAGVGSTLVVDITTNESLYLTDDSVAEALNNYYATSKISVSNPPSPFPRATGVPQLLHGDGTPEGTVFAPQGSAYMRRDNTGATASLYVKTSGAWLSTGWEALSTANIAVPTGMIIAYGASTAPTDWLLCDGSAVSRNLYSTLFGIIGTSYGSGDGSTTFNVPDMRGRMPVGFAVSGGHTDVSTLGNNDAVAEANRRPKHNHTFTNPSISAPSITINSNTTGISDSGHSHTNQAEVWASNNSYGFNLYITSGDLSHGDTIGTGTGHASISDPGHSHSGSASNPTASGGAAGVGGTAAQDAPAWLVVNYIIKT